LKARKKATFGNRKKKKKMQDWAPFLFLILFVFLFLFGRWLYSILFSENESRKEGLESMDVTTSVTIQQGTYSAVADGRALYMIYPSNLYLDFKGMNLVDIDSVSNAYYEITVVTRSGKQFSFKSYYKEIPAIDSTFFKQDRIANLKGSYPPFLYQSDWQSATTNVNVLVVPYSDMNQTDHSFVVLWDNSNVSNGLVLMSANLYSSTVTEARSAFTFSTADFPGQALVTASATLSGETTPPVVPSSGGLPFPYSDSSVSIGTMLTNAVTVMSERTVKCPHYYYVSNGVNTYPDLKYITPFVYFNPANGDMIVLQGKFGLRSSTTAVYEQTSTWTANSQIELETESAFLGMIKTTSVRRYRRPLTSSLVNLTDYKDATTLAFDIFTKGENDSQRLFQDTDNARSIRTSLSSVSSFSMCICNSTLEKRLVYHLTTVQVSVLVIVSRNGRQLQVDRIRIFENGQDKSGSIAFDPFLLPTSEYSKYQNPNALSGGTSGTSTSSSSSSGSSSSGSSSSGSSSSGSTNLDLLSGSSISGDSLGAIEKKAVYDLVASLLFSRDAYSTATGYTTKNCPACTTTPPPSEEKKTTTSSSSTPSPTPTTTTTTTPSKTTTPTKTTTSIPGLPTYESQSQTTLRSSSSSTSTSTDSSTTPANPNQAYIPDKTEPTKPAASSGYIYPTKTMSTMPAPATKTSSVSSSNYSYSGPSPGYPRTPNTSFMVDSYLRRPPNPNYRPPMPVAFDFSKIGWNT
jgi:hypothetical protein